MATISFTRFRSWRIALSAMTVPNQSYLILLRWIYTDFFRRMVFLIFFHSVFVWAGSRVYTSHFQSDIFFLLYGFLVSILPLLYLIGVCCLLKFSFRISTRKVWRVIFKLEFTDCWCFLRSFFSIHVKFSFLVYVFVCSIFIFCSVWRLSFLWKRLVMFTNAHKKIPS